MTAVGAASRDTASSKGNVLAVRVPANAFPVDSSFGSGWKCQHGYRQIDDGCVAVVVPENGVLDSLADPWDCRRGFIKQRRIMRARGRAGE